MAVMKVETDIIINISESDIGRVVMLVRIYVKTVKTDVIILLLITL